MRFRKYRVDIPTPSAKRLENDRKLVMETVTGCFVEMPHYAKTWAIPAGASSIEIEAPADLSHDEPSVLDGDWEIRFYVHYQNSTGSRKERLRVDPVPLEA